MSSYFTSTHHPAGVAFDSIAEHYDDLFTRSLIGRAQREAVWSVARKTFHRGDFVLELNCGTGEDAMFLARSGISVFACDASEKMIGVAKQRCDLETPELPLWFETLPSERVGDLRGVGPFDGVFSNFSGLNCVSDIRSVALSLSTLVKPGGSLLLCLSTRICLWETLWFLAKGDPARAFRRWKGQCIALLGEFPVKVTYPTLRELRKAFSPVFHLRSCRGIGVAVPPSYLEPLATKHRDLLSGLQLFDQSFAAYPGLRVLGDHMLLRFERVAA